MTFKTLWCLLTPDQVLIRFSTSLKTGLSQDKASALLNQFGPNVLSEKTSFSVAKILFRQFFNGIVVVLFFALLVAFLLKAWVDIIALSFIIMINALIGFVQEYSAEKSLEALKKLTKPTTRVLRDSTIQIVGSACIVPGDIVLLEAGDVVPADGRVIESHELTLNESSLTGESFPVSKSIEALPKGDYLLADQNNMVFMATEVTRGRGIIVITNTGAQTSYGEIARYIANTPENQTYLALQLTHIGYFLMGAASIIAFVIFVLGLIQGQSIVSLLYMTLSLFVAAVPEGLPAVITVALARAVRRMARKNALIRRLTSVEALASISVICTDKTGTLTQNRMTVVQMYADGKHCTLENSALVSNNAQMSLDGKGIVYAFKTAALCNNADRVTTPSGLQVRGDPTEGALLVSAENNGFSKKTLEQEQPLIKEYPFDSDRKFMSMLRGTPHGAILYVKGASSALLSRSLFMMKEGVVVPLLEEDRQYLSSLHDAYASQAFRVLAVAYKEGSKEDFNHSNDDEQGLIFVGFFAMSDPLRPEAQEVLTRAKQAGIRTIMLTGDHVETARAIALSVGLLQKQDPVLSGEQIERMADNELLAALSHTAVCARISIAHKIRIVTLLKKSGERVAMTGDGVNDAPALRGADIGIAMGITGTDVAKEASDMIIADDNYASILYAIEEGRGMYESIVKFVTYLLSSNLAEVQVVLWGSFLKMFVSAGDSWAILLPVHLLWINLVSDGLPALALIFDPLHKNLMKKKPEDFSQPLISKYTMIDLFMVSFLLSLGVVTAYLFGLRYSPRIAQTMAFTTLVLLEFVRLSSVRAEFGLSFFSNYLVVGAVTLSVLLQLALLYVPLFQQFFHTVPLYSEHWLIMAIIIGVTWGISRFFLIARKRLI